MKLKVTKQVVKIILCLSVIIGCADSDEIPTLTVGEDFTNTNIRVISIDTLEVRLSTMKFDSIITSNSQRLLFGRYEDEDFGNVKASAYFELTSDNFFIDDEATLDSVGLVLNYDNYFFNDTTQTITINVHKLLDRIDSEDGNLYNTSEFDYEPTALASFSFIPEPSRDSLYVSLPFQFGQDIFQGIQNNEIDDVESLAQILKGITIQPSDLDNGSIVGFDIAESYVKLYYTVPDELEDDDEELELIINQFSANTYFNNIQSDVSNLPLQLIDDQENILPSTESSNFSYLQAGIGYVTRIEFPSIKKLNEIPGTGTILNATLEIKPNNSSYSDIKTISDFLDLYVINQNNDITFQIANSVGLVSASLVRENEEFGDIIYSVPVLEFVDNKFLEQPETEDALILLPPEFNSTVNSLKFNDAFNDDFKAKLFLTYAILNEE
ncbi:DUF4270 family protein [Winogradskyella luteola]|uniref:DUF4270 family protein n=1 Tax=Winogradskyella luteola TaxID=2828330 RepID=A0A9X1F5Q8_9FLAO|nr:DUF4270 family protein [Winogradskyella luteola]MBV7267749.1 DUF4270 family protein [Winogradskyella luteola]